MQMIKKLLVFAISLLLVIFATLNAKAYGPEGPSPYISVTYDDGLEDGEVLSLLDVLNESSVHADMTFTNMWVNGLTASNDSYSGIVDYRVEAHTPLYNLADHKGTLVTRVEGFGLLDGEPGDGIDGFFDDPLIDIPELFVQDVTTVGNNAFVSVFGKFAHRRFIDKDEIAADPFDIGERPFFGAISGTNNLLGLVNEVGDTDHITGNIVSRQATGVYGFAFALKNLDNENFFDGWGARQAFVVKDLEEFGDTFYGASQIDKNWGTDNPGQLNLGVVYGQEDILPFTTDNSYVPFVSLIQKVNRLTGYARYGFLNSTAAIGEFTLHNFATGLSYELTNKDVLAADYFHFNSEAALGIDHSHIFDVYWRHRYTDLLSSTFYTAWGVDTVNPLAPGGADNNWLIGFNLQATL